MNFTNILEVVIPLEPILANLLPSDSSLYLIADLLVIFLLSAIQVWLHSKAAFFNTDLRSQKGTLTPKQQRALIYFRKLEVFFQLGVKQMLL
jgi:hypothetical protein